MTASIRTQYVGLLTKEAANQGVDPKLADSIIQVESGWDPWAMRFEPNFTSFIDQAKFAALNGITIETEKICQRSSWGLGQIMGQTARWLKYQGPISQLCEPETGILYCLKYLAELATRLSRIEDMAAAYNAGGVKFDADGKYKNQVYVDRVMSRYGKL